MMSQISNQIVYNNKRKWFSYREENILNIRKKKVFTIIKNRYFFLKTDLERNFFI